MTPAEPMRPGDFARLLLATGFALPRQRARDQQADRAGLDLKRRLLTLLAERDPEPDEFEATLLTIVEAIGPPTGPTRAVALIVHQEWQAACAAPNWMDHVLTEALREGEA